LLLPASGDVKGGDDVPHGKVGLVHATHSATNDTSLDVAQRCAFAGAVHDDCLSGGPGFSGVHVTILA
jgi:hypothetical protein